MNELNCRTKVEWHGMAISCVEPAMEMNCGGGGQVFWQTIILVRQHKSARPRTTAMDASGSKGQ